jgi:hypothetical protein
LSASGESSASYADFMPWADAAKILKRKQVSQFQGFQIPLLAKSARSGAPGLAPGA